MTDKQTCALDRDLMRRLIRVEHPELFGNNANSQVNNLKTLDRCLRREFSKLAPIYQRHLGVSYEERLNLSPYFKDLKLVESKDENIEPAHNWVYRLFENKTRWY